MPGSITSANSVIMLSVATIFPTAQQMLGYAAEDIFDSDEVETAEVVLGLDGTQSSGWIPFNVKWRFTLMPNSVFIPVMDTWITAQNVLKDVYIAQGNVKLPGPGKKFVLNNGTLTRGKVMPDAKKTLQPQNYEITWESVLPAPV